MKRISGIDFIQLHLLYLLKPLFQVKQSSGIMNEKRELMQKKKPGGNRAFMMDGLVSIRKFLSRHNIKNKFSDYKNFSKLFYSHFLIVCGKSLWLLRLFRNDFSKQKDVVYDKVRMFLLHR